MFHLLKSRTSIDTFRTEKCKVTFGFKYIIFVELESQMLLAKFQDPNTSGSGEEDLKVFTIYRRGGHLGHVTWTIYTNFDSPFPRTLHITFGSEWPSGF